MVSVFCFMGKTIELDREEKEYVKKKRDTIVPFPELSEKQIEAINRLLNQHP